MSCTLVCFIITYRYHQLTINALKQTLANTELSDPKQTDDTLGSGTEEAEEAETRAQTPPNEKGALLGTLSSTLPDDSLMLNNLSHITLHRFRLIAEQVTALVEALPVAGPALAQGLHLGFSRCDFAKLGDTPTQVSWMEQVGQLPMMRKVAVGCHWFLPACIQPQFHVASFRYFMYVARSCQWPHVQ